MDYVDKFMQGTLGIDILNSNLVDVKKLSDYISEHYSGFIADDDKNLEEYYRWLLKDDCTWDVLVYETEIRCFNAYRNETYEEFLKENEMMTAGEILSGRYAQFDVDENDIEDLLCLK